MSTDHDTSSESEYKRYIHRTVADLDAETTVWRLPGSSSTVHTDEGCSHITPDHREVECQTLHTDERVCRECSYRHYLATQLSREWLYEQYIENGRTSVEIAEDCSVTAPVVRRRLNKLGIETRPGGSQTPDEKLKDETWMRVQYIDKNKSTGEISDELDCSHTTVWRWLQRHEIETRAPTRTPDARLRDPEWMRARYHGDGLTQAEIGELCDCCAKTVREWMSDHDIETRSRGGRGGGST
jgi:hypothetical protein